MSPLDEFEAEDGYPTDEWLDAFIAYEPTGTECVRILAELLPEWSKRVACCQCRVEDGTDGIGRPEKVITFTTGGWSGAESLIDAIIAKPIIRHCYYSKWERGGLHEFRVPVGHLVAGQ